MDLKKHPNIKPVCLPRADSRRPDDGWYVGKKAVVAGWGRIEEDGVKASHLQVLMQILMEVIILYLYAPICRMWNY